MTAGLPDAPPRYLNRAIPLVILFSPRRENQDLIRPTQKRPLVRTIFLVALALVCLTTRSLAVEIPNVVSEGSFPEQYGKVVYRTDTGAPARIFIIANSHRSAFSGDNGSETLQSQVETYRIGEWLINRAQVDLLLPEGFFGSWEKKDVAAGSSGVFIDKAALQNRLADTSTFVNAEMLLHEVHGVGLEQVEDRALYLQTRKLLQSRLNNNSLLAVSAGEADTLDALQRLRTAVILQNSLAAMGSVPHRGAVLTLGLAHLNHIITYLDAGAFLSPALQKGGKALPELDSKHAPSSASVDISVIVPNALLDASLLASGHL